MSQCIQWQHQEIGCCHILYIDYIYYIYTMCSIFSIYMYICQEIGYCCLLLNEFFYSLFCPHPFKYMKSVSLHLFWCFKYFFLCPFSLHPQRLHYFPHGSTAWPTEQSLVDAEASTCTPHSSGTARAPLCASVWNRGPRQAGPHVYKCSPISVLLFSHHC